MRRISFIFLTILSAILMTHFISAFELNNLSNRNKLISGIQEKLSDCQKPLIYQYINNFSLPLNDVLKLSKNQFSKNAIQSFQSANKTYLVNIVSVSNLTSDDQNSSQINPFKVTVTNKKLQLNIHYTINITERTGLQVKGKNHTFNATTKVTNISFTYEKEFKPQTGTFTINQIKVEFDSNSMNSTFSPNPSPDQLTSFNNAIKGTSGNTLYTALAKLFSNDIVKQAMQTNAKGEHLSKAFSQNPYVYKYYNGFNINIDVSTLAYDIKEKQLTNGINGKLPQGNTNCGQYVPDFTNTGASMFISKQFVMNFVQYNMMKYSGWKNIKLDFSSINSKILQWRLLDLEYVVDGLWNDLTDYINNQIFYTCDVNNQISTQFQIKTNKLHQVMQWACKGFLKINSTTNPTILDFTAKINHITDLKIPESHDGTLTLLVDSLQLLQTNFNQVPSLDQKGKYVVNQDGQILAKKYIESVLYNFRIYPVGDKFVISPDAKAVQVQSAGNGIWIII